MHPILELAAVLHPMPAPGSVRPDDCHDDARDQIEQLRRDCADNLEAASDGLDADPLLLALQGARARKAAADADIRRLLAYAREFQGPRPYPLNQLAQASGYTVSGVRTAYAQEEIRAVAGQIDRTPRPGPGAAEGRGES
ncbi:hypothetical protein AB0M39_39610 [Streptomyces sp. NPDC051907]|uniref:hypothetical protein n=1 Tax=Streptomyces sp. NPDC051907 TaxID=3155284 RepID=UPI00341AAC07